jgi:CRISPR/Cas system-associated exonuclease Cas4 (RecB family)
VIIDFKTSEVAKQEDADEKARESKQLMLYSLAYKHMSGDFPKRVELYFLESGVVGSAAIEEKNIEKLVVKIREAAQGIRNADFSARPTFMACTYCAFNAVCPCALRK